MGGWLLVLGLLNGADLLTTQVALRQSAVIEGNPLRPQAPTWNAVAMGVYTGVELWGLHALAAHRPTTARWLATALIAGEIAIVVHNGRVIAATGGNRSR